MHRFQAPPPRGREARNHKTIDDRQKDPDKDQMEEWVVLDVYKESQKASEQDLPNGSREGIWFSCYDRDEPKRRKQEDPAVHQKANKADLGKSQDERVVGWPARTCEVYFLPCPTPTPMKGWRFRLFTRLSCASSSRSFASP